MRGGLGMNTHSCCQPESHGSGNGCRPATWWQRTGTAAGWLLPTAGLALLPKCPVCLAAYVALATGIGISLPTATYLRTSMVILCVATLFLLTARYLRRAFSTSCK